MNSADVTVNLVGQSSFIALSPWNLLLSWKRPEGAQPWDIKGYVISGDFERYVGSTDLYMFLPINDKVEPDIKYTVVIKTLYQNGESSDTQVVLKKAFSASKFNFFMFSVSY